MSRFAWIVTIPVTVLVVLFAVSNRQSVLIDLFPLPSTVTAPLFVVVLASLALGVLIGAAIEGARGWRTRRALKEAARRADALGESLAALKAKHSAPPAPVPPPVPPLGASALPPATAPVPSILTQP
jgi:uncharacterized integral membrane protein